MGQLRKDKARRLMATCPWKGRTLGSKVNVKWRNTQGGRYRHGGAVEVSLARTRGRTCVSVGAGRGAGESGVGGTKQPPQGWTKKKEKAGQRLPCSSHLLLFIIFTPLEEGIQNISKFNNSFCRGSRIEINA